MDRELAATRRFHRRVPDRSCRSDRFQRPSRPDTGGTGTHLARLGTGGKERPNPFTTLHRATTSSAPQPHRVRSLAWPGDVACDAPLLPSYVIDSDPSLRLLHKTPERCTDMVNLT